MKCLPLELALSARVVHFLEKKLISVIGGGDYYFPVLQYLLFDSLIVSIVANIYGNLTVEFFRS